MRPLRENDASPLRWENEFLEMYLSSRKYPNGVNLIQGQIHLTSEEYKSMALDASKRVALLRIVDRNKQDSNILS